ncbi:MAG: hypothetical protein AB7I41_04090 [Candidatus Sericytochromatia bacterium]
MIDLSKVNVLLSAALEVAQQQQQVNASQQTAPAAAQPGLDPATNQLFNQLSALLNNANTQSPATQDPARTALLQKAAELSAKTKALMAKADLLESTLNMAPTPEARGIDELFAEFTAIMEQLQKDMGALQKQAQEREDANKMTCEQKPTALKPGENSADMSFNTTFSMQ